MALTLPPPRNPREEAANALILQFEKTAGLNHGTINGLWIRFALEQVAAIQVSRDVALCATGIALGALGITNKAIQYAILVQVACQPLDLRSERWAANLPGMVAGLAVVYSLGVNTEPPDVEQLDVAFRRIDPTRLLPADDGRRLTLGDMHAARAGYRAILDTLGFV